MLPSIIQSQENQNQDHKKYKSGKIGKKAKKDIIVKNLNLGEVQLDNDQGEGQVLHTEDRLLPTPGQQIRRSSTNQRHSLKPKIDMMGKLNSYIFKEKVKRMQSTNYSKTKHFEFLYFQYMANTMAQCIFSLASIFSGILAYEFEFSGKKDSFKLMAEWWCFITSIFLWITIIYEHYISSKIFSLNKSLPERIARKEFDNLTSLICTLIIFFLHPNPVFYGVDVTIYNQKYDKVCVHSVNSIMACFCLLRMWYLVKFYLVVSDYYSPRSQRVCLMNGFDTNLTFSMKANMAKTPYFAYLLLFIIILMYCSFCLRIFERVLDEVSGKDFTSYWNAVWCLIITMTTVGYGDYFPSSTLGRTIGIIACICGVFLISMLIVTITNILHFEGTEENVFLILQRLKLTKEKDTLAAQLISKYMKLMKHLKHAKDDPQQALKTNKALREDILLGLYYLKEKTKEIDGTFPAYSNFDIVIDNLEMLDFSMNTIKTKYEKLEKNLQQLIQKIE